MVQGQSQIAGEKEEERDIWYTYHALALRATREALGQDLDVKAKVREEKSDECLACVQNSRPPCFSKSIVAIVMCVFVIEYRINETARCEGIQQNKKVRSYIKYEPDPDTVDSCLSYDTTKESICNKEKKFKCLSLYEKWRNIEKILKKKDTQEYLDSVQKLYKWIWVRNKIAHGDYEEIMKIQISPKQALICYDDITRAIFGLNTAVGYGTKGENDRDCNKMLLGE
ncbi:MAG: hypothetical protein GH144_00515 [Clostridia bacterium]|jgi:hypothetical protein|nr:hypothetical protein [Clostridia bacterium]